jgi:nicotinamidase-related amidase
MSTSGTGLAHYRRKGLAGTVGFGRAPAVLVVDAIVGFTDPTCPLGTDYDREIAAITRLLTRARQRRVPVFFTTTAYDATMADAGVFVDKVPSLRHLQRGSRLVALDPRLARRAGEVLIEKQFASAFFGTPLASLLATARVDTLIVTGFTTSGCIRATAVDGLQHGYRVIVPRECVGDRAARPHEANLFDIQGKYGDVLSLAAVLRKLSARR